MKYLLVLQFPSFVKTLAQLVELEDELERELASQAEIDGHDFGAGEGNIFVRTDDPGRTFAQVKQVLDLASLDSLKAAYRDLEGESYTILWPPDLGEFQVR